MGPLPGDGVAVSVATWRMAGDVGLTDMVMRGAGGLVTSNVAVDTATSPGNTPVAVTFTS